MGVRDEILEELPFSVMYVEVDVLVSETWQEASEKKIKKL